MVEKIDLYADDPEPRQKDVKKRREAQKRKAGTSGSFTSYQRAVADGLDEAGIMERLGIGPLQLAAYKGRASI